MGSEKEAFTQGGGLKETSYSTVLAGTSLHVYNCGRIKRPRSKKSAKCGKGGMAPTLVVPIRTIA